MICSHMERRDVLKSASTLAAVSTVGLAGCSGGGLLGGGGCSTPDSLSDSYPEGDSYNQQQKSSGSGSDFFGENVEGFASAAYTGSNDNRYTFIALEYSNESVASDQTENASDAGGGGSGGATPTTASGYIQAGAYIFVASGPDESSVTSFMKASPTFSDGCVDNNLEFT
jgi:hypothetical protein